MMDLPEENSRVVAPSANFHVAFSKNSDFTEKKNYIFALWAVMNHPIASLWLHENSIVQTIPTKNFRNFPLPNKWGRKEDIGSLAFHAKDLIDKIREKRETFSQISTIDIEKIVKAMDDIVFQMYEITNSERLRIEAWFDKDSRPGLEDFYKIKKSNDDSSRVEHIAYEESTLETTFETSDINFEKGMIKLVIDGLPHNSDESASDDGIWLKIIPVMPGWAMEKGALGWIELTTQNENRLIQSPARYLLSFRLNKNAYKTQEEIDKNTFKIANVKSIKGVS